MAIVRHILPILFLAVIVPQMSEWEPQLPKGQKLTVQQTPERVVFAWTGEVANPMRNEFTEQLERFASDSRRLVVTLNSQGGLVSHGHEVMTVIDRIVRYRQLETHVDAGSICASMCVPIYLMGTRRTAHPRARFMFHEVHVDLTATPAGLGSYINSRAIKEIEKSGTDKLFEQHLRKSGVDQKWLDTLRQKITRGDYWATGEELMAARSGIVDALLP